MSTRFLVAAATWLLAAVPSARAAQAPWNVATDAPLSAAVDKVYSYYDAPHMPGAIVAVLRHGEVVHLRGYGYANREFDAPWTPDTLYTFFSTTKSMTCLALLELAEQGKVSLDDEIQTYLTDFPRFDRRITIRHLLNHTSGLWQDESLLHLAGTGAAYVPLTLQELYDLNRKQRALPYAPGSNWYYNDAGMRLAARLIEKVTGQDFGAAMKTLVFGPAGMKTARIKSYEPEYYPNEASSYLLAGPPRPNPATDAVRIGGIIVETSGDGGGMGTIQDYIAYARYVTAPRPNGKRWIDELTTSHPANAWYTPSYRYGFLDETHRGLRIVHHGGFYGKRIAYLPELDIWVLQMRNGLDYDVQGDVQRMLATVDAVLSTVKDGYYLSARNPLRDAVMNVPPDQKWTATELKRLSGTFVEQISGYVVTLTASNAPGARRLEYKFQGDGGVLVRRGKAKDYVSYGGRIANAVRLVETAEGLRLQYADWPEPRALQPVPAERDFTAAEIESLLGWYRNDALGVHYQIVREAGGLQLCIDGGNRLSERFGMRSVTPDVFEAVPDAAATYLNLKMVVKIERSGGNPVRLRLTTIDVKDLLLEKLPASHPN